MSDGFIDGFDFNGGIPDELKERDQWLLWSHDSDPPKKPLNEDGWGASWNDPSDWLSFDRAVKLVRAEDRFDGIGYVVSAGDPYVAIDFDGCLREPFQPKPKEWLPALDAFEGTYIEYSQSGTGLHPFVRDARIPDWWSDSHFSDGEHEGIEVYDEKFFIVTGKRLEELSGPTIEEVDIAPFLSEAYEEINGKPPLLPGGSGGGAEVDVSVYDVISRSSYPEDENRGHPFHGSDTGTNFRVDPGGETFRCWRHSITGNALHLLGMDQGIISCGDWESGFGKETWREIFDAAREAGLDVGDRGDDDDGPTHWGEVRWLFDSEEKGSTTKGYGAATTILCREHDFVAVRESDQLYYYRPDLGYYVRKGTTFIDELVERAIPKHTNNSRLQNIRHKVVARNYLSNEDFVPPEGKANVKNGVIDLDRWADDPDAALKPHSPDYFFTGSLNVEYDPGADDGGLLMEAVGTAIPNEDERKKFFEFVGYSLEMWTTFREKCYLLVGKPNSGKSTVQEVYKALFGGPPAATSLAPHQISDGRFDVASLREAVVNTMNDINAGKIEDTGALKRIISGEATKLEHKFGDPHFGEPKAKHLWTANWLPRLTGQDDSLYRRFLITEFNHQIPAGEIDERFKTKLKTDPAVRQVLLNKALEGRARLVKQGGFTTDRDRIETRRLYDSWRDSHKRFLYTHFEVTGNRDDAVPKQDYWQAYEEFASIEGYQRISNMAVSKALQWVPEVHVNGDGDDYTGLRCDDADAPSIDESPGNKRLDEVVSQESRINRLKNLVKTLQPGSGSGVPIENLVDEAADLGLDREKTEHDIENLLERGELEEPVGGCVRTVR